MFPTLFKIGPVAIHSYGTLLMLGFVAGILLSVREAKRLDISPEVPLDLGIWVLIVGVVFARGTHVLLDWGEFANRPVEILCVWRTPGLSFHGGLAGGVLAGLVFTWRSRLPFWTVADMVTPGIALAYGIARFGCLLNGCCYGMPTGRPWAVEFAYWGDSEVRTLPSHPTQVYAALGSFAILGILLAVRGRLRAGGQLFLLYLILYAPMRAAVEVLRRGETAEVLFGDVTEAQAASAVIFVAALWGFIVKGRRHTVAESGEPDSQ